MQIVAENRIGGIFSQTMVLLVGGTNLFEQQSGFERRGRGSGQDVQRFHFTGSDRTLRLLKTEMEHAEDVAAGRAAHVAACIRLVGDDDRARADPAADYSCATLGQAAHWLLDHEKTLHA